MNTDTGNIGSLADVMADAARARQIERLRNDIVPKEAAQSQETAAKLGYRQLSDVETACVLRAREIGNTIKALLDDDKMKGADPRWTAVARTHFQEGLMALVRGITKPTFF